MLVRAGRQTASIIKQACTRMQNYFGSIQKYSPEDLKKSQKYVQETLRSRNWVTYMLASYIPGPLRPAYYTIHLFDLQITKIAQNVRQPSLAIGKLDFWKQVVHQVYSGKKPQPEPLSICLQDAVLNNPLTMGYFTRLMNVRAQEINKRTMSSMTEMRQMADDSKSTLLALTLQLMRIQIDNDHMREVVGYLGQAIGICEYLRRIPYSLRNNRFLVPEEVLSKYNLTTKNIWDRVYGKPSEDFFDAVLEIAAYAKQSFESSCKIFQQNPGSFNQQAFRAFLRGVETESYLQNLQKYNFNIFDSNLNTVSPVKLPYRVYNAAKAKKFWVGGDKQV